MFDKTTEAECGSNPDVYEDLIRWFRESGAYVPDSHALRALMKACYAAEEAELLTGMPLELTDIEEIARGKGLDAVRLAKTLDRMTGRGLVFRAMRDERTVYRVNPPRFVFLRSFFWPGNLDSRTKSVATWTSRYYRDGFGDHWKHAKTKGLRALPVQSTIQDPRRILAYEDVLQVLARQDRFAVAHCACRHRSNMDDEARNCDHEVEVCLHFGKLANYIIDAGLGREITLSEAESILDRCAKAGLVHAASNWQRNIDTICNCCKCCCVYFQAYHVLKHSGSMSPSAYRVETLPQTCTGCGRCAKRCPMGILELRPHRLAKNKLGTASTLTSDHCIGCGVCARGCPSGSLRLVRRDHTIEPPVDVADLKQRYAREVAAGSTADVSSGEPGS